MRIKMFALNSMEKKCMNSICHRQMQLNPPKRRNKSATQMKSSQSSDEVAVAIGGFNSTENAVFDFIRISGLHHNVTSS